MIKGDLFKYIDENGIDGYWKSGVIINLDTDHDKELPNIKMMDDFFEPCLYKFELTNEKKIELIKDYFIETFGIYLESLNDLNMLNVLNGNLFLFATNQNNRFVYKIVKKHCEFDLYIRNVFGVKNLGIIESIKGGLFLSNTSIQSLYPLIYLDGDFWQSGVTKEFLKDLGNLEIVTGTLNLSKSNINDLGNLKKIGGNLNLRATSIIDLSNIKEVGGNLLLNKHLENQYILNPKIVHGKIKYFKT